MQEIEKQRSIEDAIAQNGTKITIFCHDTFLENEEHSPVEVLCLSRALGPSTRCIRSARSPEVCVESLTGEPKLPQIFCQNRVKNHLTG